MRKSLSKRYPGAALITGASAGLGSAFAHYAAREGMDLVLVARREKALEQLAMVVRKEYDVQAYVLPLDLAQAGAAEEAAAFTTEHRLRVSMLINNAGFGTHGRFHELDPAREAQMVDLNCRAPVALSAAFAPAMVERGNGAIILVASTAAYQATPFMATYGATKAFNLHYGEALWAELRPHGVDVLALSPGFTRTEFHKAAAMEDLPPAFLWAEPEDVVRTCFKKLGRSASVVHGNLNKLGTQALRLSSRRMNTRIAGTVMKPRQRRA